MAARPRAGWEASHTPHNPVASACGPTAGPIELGRIYSGFASAARDRRSLRAVRTADVLARESAALATIRNDLRTLNVSFEERAVLHRVMLLTERNLGVLEAAEPHPDEGANVV